jgi:hypothetical protein
LREDAVVLICVSLVVFAGVGILYMAMSNRRALREMEHRERLAMIQRGLVPSPEADPVGFEEAMDMPYSTRKSARSDRWRSAGVVTMGFGLALMMLLSFVATETNLGIGLGGAFAVLGATAFFNGLQMSREDALRHRFHPGPLRPRARASDRSMGSAPPEL